MYKVLVVIVFFWGMTAFAEDHSSCPLHAEHQKQMDAEHHKHVDEAGDRVMGFERSKTTHHFLLRNDGGVIVADAIDAKDTESIEQIRKHFVEIAALFSRGDFSMPHEIHGRVPPGVQEMTDLKDRIRYTFQERERGGEVRIKTEDEQALKAIHAFLRFQIEDHRTGDPLNP
jgi:hypothetical protein